ncbi:hypothetical protein D9613_004825 [Agrocybe pediades]|uniref:Uncharacterized protein n=1 Tax=Agrocybe pediades TaxID=84607 RepID=A0A8H4R0F9_9AGAR|nr:hypothetical protein D9613_004825 [Agrocybe pediades]
MEAFLYILFATVSHIFSIVMWRVFWDTPYNMLSVTFNSCLLNVGGQRFVLELRTATITAREVELPRFSNVVFQVGTASGIELDSISGSKVP